MLARGLLLKLTESMQTSRLLRTSLHHLSISSTLTSYWKTTQKQKKKLSRQATAYCMIRDDIYNKATNGVLLKCITSDDGKELFLDIHEGIYRYTPTGEYWLGKFSDKVFTGQQLPKTLLTWYNGVKLVNLIADTPSYQIKLPKPSLCPGHFCARGLTSSNLFHEDKVATKFLFVAIKNSLSGYKRSQQEKLKLSTPSSSSKRYSSTLSSSSKRYSTDMGSQIRY